MTQKDIFQNMTKGEWTVRTDTTKNGDTAVVIFTDNHTIEFTKVRPKFSQQFIADAIARAEAVNNTYGKGINPEKVKALYLNLESALSMIKRLDSERPDPGYETAFDQNVISEINRIEMVLNSSKL